MTLLKEVAVVILLAGTASGALVACEEQGPAEKAGEKIDNAVEDAKDAVKN